MSRTTNLATTPRPTVLAKLFRPAPHDRAAADLYDAIVGQARQPAFYERLGVPDTLDGRFELVVLHAFLVLHRLKGEPAAAGVSQALFDRMVDDMDASLREMGVGDLSVGKRVKAMGRAFYGRAVAYEAGLASPDRAVLEDAVRRNVYGTATPSPAHPAAIAGYLRRQVQALSEQATDTLMAGRVRFEPAPGQGAP
jgi:cytochrome b pre-mRNA-processing protein 3